MRLQRPQHLYSYPLWLDFAERWRAIPSGAIILIVGLVAVFSGCGGGGIKPPATGVSFTIARSANPPDAIAGHAYSAFIGTSLSLSAAPDDVVTSCSLSGSFPSGMTAAPGAPSSGAAYYCVLTMSSAPAAGQYNFTLQAADGSTPAKTDSHSYTLAIRSDFTFTTTTLAPGVQGRAYGVTPLSQPEATNIGTTQAGLTVGNGPLTACTLVSVTPSNPGLTVALDATKTQCLLSSSALTGAGTFRVTLSAAETQITDSVTGAAAVPAAATTPATAALALIVNAPLTLAANQGSTWATAVSNRPYGSGVGCTGGACTPVVYTASGGLGDYVFPASTPASMPAGMVCPAVSGSATYTCAAPAPGITAAAGTYSPAVTVADAGNSATPPATSASDPLRTRTDSLVVAAPLALSVDAASAPVNPAPPGAINRSYGNTAAGFKDLAFDAAHGLGNYVFSLPPSVAAPSANGVPAAIACAASGPTAACTSGASAISASSGTYPFSVTLNDTGNTSTPSASASGTQPTAISGSVAIIPALSLSLTQSGNGASPNPAHLLLGATGRSYGIVGGMPTYTASGGSGTYVFPASPGPYPAGFVCVANTNTYTCSANSISAAAATYPLSLSVSDAANATTPGGNVTSISSLSVNAPINLAVNLGASWPPAVQNRRYGSGTGCTGGACTSPTYTATNGLGGYAFPGSTPASFPNGMACVAASPNYTCSSVSVSASAATYHPSVAVTDTGNAAVPAATTGTDPTSTRTDAVTVNAEMTLTPPGTVPVAVVGRRYGAGAGCSGGSCTPLTYTVPAATPGLGGYTFTLNSFPTGFACLTSTNNGNCSAGAVGGSAGTFSNLNVTVRDTANASTPSNSVTSSPNTALTVYAELAVTPPGTVPAAVVGRAYGTGAGCSGGNCTPLTFTVPPTAPGLGGPYTSSANNFPSGFTCSTNANNVNCSAGAVGGNAGTFNSLTVTATDTANASTPSGSVPSSPATTLTVDAEMVLTPPGSIAAAVTGRTYGQGSTCGAAGTSACVPLNFAVANGLGNYASPATMTTTAGTFSCPLSAATYQCSSAMITGSGAPTLSLTASETGNAATPGSSKTDATKSLPINPEMNFTSTPTSPLADAVAGRTYGQGSTCGAGSTACTPLTYTIQSGTGLGGYTYAFSPSIGFTCASGNPTSNCTSLGVTGGANSYANVHTSVTDTANASVPSNTIASSNGSLTVHLEMTVTPPASVATSVHGRAYGTGTGCSGGACQPLQYTVSRGLGNYTLTGSSLATPSDTFTCTLASPTFSCFKAAIVGVGGTNPLLTFTGAETGNASTPAHTVTDTSKTLSTQAEMTVTPPASVPTAVTGRSFGTAASGCSGPGGACVGLIYAVSNGLGNYTLTGSSLKTASDTLNCSLASSNFSCNDASISGNSNAALTFIGAETGNVSTPGNTVTDSTKTLPTHAEMTVTPPATVAPAVHGRAYGTGTGCTGPGGNCVPLQYNLSNGLGNYTVTGTSLTTPLDSFTCTLASPTFSCSKAAIAGAGGSSPTLTFTGAEAGNASTPGHTVTDTSKALTTNAALVATPPASVPAAVTGRRYGTGTGCSGGSCQPLQYSLSNGLGNFTLTGSSLTTPSDSFTCTLASPTYSCSDADILGSTTATLTFTGAETGNASAPGGTAVDASLTLNAGAPLAVTVSIGGSGYAAASPWPVGVTNRPYGSGSGCAGGTCAPPIYTATGGLGGYTFANFAALTGMGFTCTPSAPGPSNMTCSASPMLTTGAGAYSPTVTARDTANVSTPSATVTSDPNSILTSSLAVNPEISILNKFMENATVGEPYSAILDSGAAGGAPCTSGAPYNCAGVGPAYTWSVTAGGIAGVSLLAPPGPPYPFGDPAGPADDPSLDFRGYYQGTPTTAGAAATTFQVADRGNATTPSCSTTATCPTLALTGASAPKVFAANGFAATLASGAGEQGNTLFAFATSSPFTSPFNLKLDSNGNPVTPRVTPDGNWVYVTEYGSHQVAVVNPATGTKEISSITVSNTGTSNPTGLDIEPQRYLTANPNSCTTHCSNLNPFIRYDAYVTDPTDGSQNTAKVEPIPDAENPGALPATLLSANALTVANANNLAISANGAQAFLSLDYLPSGTACGVPPCNTLSVLTLPALSAGSATTYPPAVLTTLNTFGLRGGAVAVDPRGQYVATATRDNTGTYTYITVTSTGATPAFVTYIPTTAGPTNTVNVCSASGNVFTPVAAIPTAITVPPDGNRLFVSCLDTATPQLNDTVGVWDISARNMGVPFIQSIALPPSSGAPIVNAENGCTTPRDVKAKLTDDSTTSTYGTRLFVSCQDSDTVVPIDYNTTTDAVNVYASVVSTDGTAITNATLGNTTAAYTTYACGHTGSCPQLLDVMPNPSLHITTGGYARPLPFALPTAAAASGYFYYVVAQGGAVPRTWSNPDSVLSTDPNCAGLSLNGSTGQISGTPANTGVTCGGTNGFVIRVTDASGQFVERAFIIHIN